MIIKYHTRLVITDADIQAMRERNEARRNIMKRVLGDKYILAGSNKVVRKSVNA